MTVQGSTAERKEGYVAPVLGNGNMSFQADYEGTMRHTPDHAGITNNPDLRIWWAGRRYLHKPERDLVSFGCFGQRLSDGGKEARLARYEQTLDTRAALLHTACLYDGGAEVETELFLHHDRNLIAVKKNISKPADYRFDYYLCGVKDTGTLPELMTVTSCECGEDGVCISYQIEAGMYPYRGTIWLFSDVPARAEANGTRFSLTTGGSGVFYLLFCDNVDREDYAAYAQRVKREVLQTGYEGLRLAHIAKWQGYMSEGYASIGDREIDSAYATAQYHLKCYTTRWSVPVGLNNGSWHGKYFAFDEFYMLMGLLTSNHLAAAKHIPVFRHDGLKYATERASSPPYDYEPEAHYPWETLENGTEGAINGFWHDHVFHMACIACGEYFYYKFSGDETFLRETAWPVIKRCTRFYLNHMIYPTGNGGAVVGKCTDLERLGHSRANAYMTTCGVIRTLSIFDELSRVLGEDTELAETCRETAARLKRCLPNDGEKYIPYPGCPDTSIGLLSGIYPFDVVEKDNAMQAAGIESYLASENKVGNMYSVGTGVCSWYMTWKALVFARLQKREETLAAIRNAAKNTGYFGEMYEINDGQTKTFYRPWFTTAAGMLVHSVNEMLLQMKDGRVFIGPALPEEIRTFSFRLAVPGGLCVEAAAQEGRLVKLTVEGAEPDAGRQIEIVLPKHIAADVAVLGSASGKPQAVICTRNEL